MWIVYALLAAFSAATAVTLTKAGLKKVDPVLAFSVQSVLILVISWSAVIIQQKLGGVKEIGKQAWVFLVCAGIATCFSSLFSYSALKTGDASMVTSLERLSLVITIVLAVLFLKESVNWKVIAGAVLMVGGAVLIGLSREG